MNNYVVAAFLTKSIAVADNQSPNLEELLYSCILKRYAPSFLEPNPTIDKIKLSVETWSKHCPLAISNVAGHMIAHISNPIYVYSHQDVLYNDKRRDRQEPPLFLRETTIINWFVKGDINQIMGYLRMISFLGEPNNHGYGRVEEWAQTPTHEDYSMIMANRLHKTMPLECAQHLSPGKAFSVQEWRWKPPTSLPKNRAICAMAHTTKLLSLPPEQLDPA